MHREPEGVNFLGGSHNLTFQDNCSSTSLGACPGCWVPFSLHGVTKVKYFKDSEKCLNLNFYFGFSQLRHWTCSRLFWLPNNAYPKCRKSGTCICGNVLKFKLVLNYLHYVVMENLTVRTQVMLLIVLSSHQIASMFFPSALGAGVMLGL